MPDSDSSSVSVYSELLVIEGRIIFSSLFVGSWLDISGKPILLTNENYSEIYELAETLFAAMLVRPPSLLHTNLLSFYTLAPHPLRFKREIVHTVLS